PWFLAGWGWFLLLLLPASGLVTISDNFAPDRYAYLAHLGLFVVIVGGAVALTGRLRRPTAVPAAAAAAAVVLLAAMAAVQTAHWKSSEGLWRHCLAVTSRNYFAHNKLAVHLLEAGREDEGLAHLRAAVGAQPDFAFAHANLGKVLAKRGELEAAIGHFERAIAVKPRDAAMRLALLPLLRDADRPPADTIAHLDALVALDPRDARLRYDLATALQRAQRLEDALPHYLAAAALAPPSNFLIRGDLGAVLVQLGRFPEAIPHLRAAARQPDNPFAPRAHYLLGLAYHKTGQNERAIPALEAAVATDPAFRPARTALDGLRNNPAP
ncbi:MAG: tetratricopeptide repeat protein, partial [Akkermansiaceae bacterium]|nr:tetratricopeptide repeat protein [Akkermansiaceae bacterium]